MLIIRIRCRYAISCIRRQLVDTVSTLVCFIIGGGIAYRAHRIDSCRRRLTLHWNTLSAKRSYAYLCQRNGISAQGHCAHNRRRHRACCRRCASSASIISVERGPRPPSTARHESLSLLKRVKTDLVYPVCASNDQTDLGAIERTDSRCGVDIHSASLSRR